MSLKYFSHDVKIFLHVILNVPVDDVTWRLWGKLYDCPSWMQCRTDWGRVESGVSLLQINSLISARPRYQCSLLDEELEKQRSNEGTLLTETQIYLKPFIPTLWSRMLTNIIPGSFHPDPDLASLHDPQPTLASASAACHKSAVTPSSAPSLRD